MRVGFAGTTEKIVAKRFFLAFRELFRYSIIFVNPSALMLCHHDLYFVVLGVLVSNALAPSKPFAILAQAQGRLPSAQ